MEIKDENNTRNNKLWKKLLLYKEFRPVADINTSDTYIWPLFTCEAMVDSYVEKRLKLMKSCLFGHITGFIWVFLLKCVEQNIHFGSLKKGPNGYVGSLISKKKQKYKLQKSGLLGQVSIPFFVEKYGFLFESYRCT